MHSGVPTTVIVHFRAREGKRQQLRNVLTPAIPRLTELDGCLGGSLYNEIGQPDLFVLIEHWESKQAHQRYISLIEGDGTMQRLSPLLAGPPTRKYLKTEA